jgi:hypothetical protein
VNNYWISSRQTMPKKEKVKGKDSQASLATKRVNFFHSKKKNYVQNQDNLKDESNASNDSDERITSKDLIESLENDAQVGAFAIAGSHGGTVDVEEPELPDSRLSMTQQSQDCHCFTFAVDGHYYPYFYFDKAITK